MMRFVLRRRETVYLAHDASGRVVGEMRSDAYYPETDPGAVFVLTLFGDRDFAGRVVGMENAMALMAGACQKIQEDKA